jgi:hydrogenase maturation protein HypF
LRFEHDGESIAGADAAIEAAQRALVLGQIVAIKGIGGYHLACRADDPSVIERLRARKARDQKPFALLARSVDVARQFVNVDDSEAAALSGQARPIVLMVRRGSAPIDDSVASGNPLLGVLLPYSPIHHLLLAPVPGSEVIPLEVIVMTSANISNEPLCFDDSDASSRLPYLADSVLTHNRPIFLPCDDSVVRVVDRRPLLIRRSRGYTPLPVALGQPLPATLAVGGELKNTFCLVDGSNAFCSAHVGDMGSLETNRAFERAVGQMTTAHRIQPQVIAADAHPAYQTRAWAERHAGGPGQPALIFVQHHHAHVVSLLVEHGRIGEPIIGVAFDGTGYGEDGSVWGGEFLLLRERSESYERAGHLLGVGLPGGDGAVRNPCRMALAYLAASDLAWAGDLAPVAACDTTELRTVRMQIGSRGGSVQCTSMGRLFDAVAALLGVRQRVGYEGQAAIELEILAARASGCSVTLKFDVDTFGVIDYRPMIRDLVAALRAGVGSGELAYGFHLAVAEAVGMAVCAIAHRSGVGTVGLTGGVFQNVLLTALCRRRLEECDFEVLTHRIVPPNDGGLALGQAVVAALDLATRRFNR